MKKTFLLLVLLSIAHSFGKPKGLENCGASCYLNAATQSLINIKELTTTILKLTIEPQQLFAFAYQQLLIKIQTTTAPKITNRDPALANYQNIGTALIAEQTRRAPNSQEDASEFFVLALNALKSSSLDLDQLISNYFGFFQTKKTACPNPYDKTQILTYYTPSLEQVKLQNPEYNLSLPIVSYKSGDAPLKTLDACLRDYFSEEIFNDPTSYISFQGTVSGLEFLTDQPLPNCTQKTYLINAPEIVLISLKRTGWDIIKQQPVRFSHQVAIPSLLSIRDYMKEQVRGESYEYTPINIIVQTGGAQGGHYRAYIKDNGSWYECNDQFINEVQGTPDNPISALMQKDIDNNAYVIFYKKINLSEEPQWAQKIQELKEGKLKQQLTNLTNILDLLQKKLASE